MGRQSSSLGFTIIESVLFLAISGILVVALIAGTGASINIQRYRDAVESFKALVQDQYGALSSVRNDRDNNWTCNSLAQTQEASSGEFRGQSECVLLGRYVTVEDGNITLSTVVGRSTTTVPTTTDDITSLRDNYVLNVSSSSEETKTMEWGARIAWPLSGDGARPAGTSRSLALLFVRSPDSGQIYTFNSDTVPSEPTPASLKSMLVSGTAIPGQSERTICIDSNGAFFNTDLSVFMTAYANGPSSVETRSNSYITSIGGSTQC